MGLLFNNYNHPRLIEAFWDNSIKILWESQGKTSAIILSPLSMMFILPKLSILNTGSAANCEQVEVEWVRCNHFLAGLNYDCKKYLLRINGRYDGSLPRFAEGRKLWFLPSFSTADGILSRGIYAAARNLINEFKIRGS